MCGLLCGAFALAGCGSSSAADSDASPGVDAAAGADAGPPDDGGGEQTCDSSSDCDDPTRSICSSAGLCVECTSDDHCDGEAPICDGSGACAACADHAECPSGVCERESGACADETAILYVDPTDGVSGSECEREEPCRTVATATSRLAAGRPYIHLRHGIYTEGGISFPDELDAILIGNGATIQHSSSDTPVLRREIDDEDGHGSWRIEAVTVEGGRHGVESIRSDLELADVTVRGAAETGVLVHPDTIRGVDADVRVVRARLTDSGGRGLHVEGNSRSGEPDESSFILSRSYVGGNEDTGVFVRHVSSARIDNNFIVDNSGDDRAGAIHTEDPVDDAEPFEIEFNTIADNTRIGEDVGVASVRCGIGGLAANNTVHGGRFVEDDGDGDPESPAQTEQVGGECDWMYSNVEGGVSGAGNLAEAPAFADPDAGDYRLTPESPEVGAADPEATLDIDFFGDPRPQGDRRDIGADELLP